MTAYLIEHPPRIRQYRQPRRSKPSGVIVVHTAEWIPDTIGPDGAAEATADFIVRRTNYGSYHDLADSDSLIQLVPYDAEAYHDGTGSNPHSYGVSAATQAAKWLSLPAGWRDRCVRNMARGAARYAKWLKATHGIAVPARRITRAQSEARVPGFISHAERDPDRRTDPGKSFPWDLFFRYFVAEMTGGTPPPEEIIDMTEAEIRALFAELSELVRQDIRQDVSNTTLDMAQTKLAQDQDAFLARWRQEFGIHLDKIHTTLGRIESALTKDPT